MKHILLTAAILLSTVIPGISQKVKYKDLFVLLKAENYANADPYLRSFLLNEPEHPNANYYMGRMLQSYLTEQDILNNSNRVAELADSSIQYYNNALTLTTEKFIKKREDYYVDFKRRDIRTGKFIVKISDVQLDMEQRMDLVKKYKSDVSNMILHFNSAVSQYDSTKSYYARITEAASSKNVLFFNTGPDELQLLRKLAARYDSCIYHFQTFQSLMKDLGKKSTTQKLVENTIESYPLEKEDKADFFAETVEILNYKVWANGTEDAILKQVYPLKKRMVAFDLRLEELHDRIIADSLDARAEIFRLATENVARDIEDFDDSSLPAAIFYYRIAEINYHSSINYWYKVVADTSHVGVKLDVLDDLGKQQLGNAKLLKSLQIANNISEKLIFKEFIAERYQDDSGMDAFIDAQAADVNRDNLLLTTLLNVVLEDDKYAYWHNESIALEPGSQISNPDSFKYSTVMIKPLSERNMGFYAWMEKADSLSLAFSISPSSRLLDTLYTVPINSLVAADNDVLNLKYISDSLAVQKLVWVLNTTELAEDSTYHVQVFTTHLSEGAGWSREFSVKEIPNAVKYQAADHRIVLLNVNEETILLLNENGEEQEILEMEDGDQ